MDSFTKLPSKQLYLILILCGIIIFFISMETMMKVKDRGMFLSWVKDNKDLLEESLSMEEYFNLYLVANLSILFLKVIIPMALSIHSYFSYIRMRINKLFIFIWTTLLLGALAYNIIELNLDSIFFYLIIISYIILIISILSLASIIDKEMV